MAMSAKRPVSRFRQVIELSKVDRRDPRFDGISAGNTDVNLTQRSYDFVPDLMRDEFHNLKAALALAQKRERTSPRAEREEREAERERLEREVARARSRVERYERETREREVSRKVKHEEREKRSEGNDGFYVKRSDKKDMLLKARYEALEKKGGKRAVKKAIEKKQKKVAGKEKKSRPFAMGSGGVGAGGISGGGGGPPPKRRRV